MVDFAKKNASFSERLTRLQTASLHNATPREGVVALRDFTPPQTKHA
jgi:hypothetical protein